MIKLLKEKNMVSDKFLRIFLILCALLFSVIFSNYRFEEIDRRFDVIEANIEKIKSEISDIRMKLWIG